MGTSRISRRMIDDSRFVLSHGRSPKGRGWWIFTNLQTGDEITVKDSDFGPAWRSLPAGSWTVEP